MGAVWRGRDEVLGRDVALKRIGVAPGGMQPRPRCAPSARPSSPPGSTTPTSSRSSTWSSRAASQQWLVMEYVEGTNLAELVRDDGPLGPTRPRRSWRQAAERAGRRARRRHRAPRREAVQHPGHARRPGEALRLRDRPHRGRRLAHPDRAGDRLAGVPLPRGRLGPAGDAGQRRVVAGAPRSSTRSRATRRTRSATTCSARSTGSCTRSRRAARRRLARPGARGHDDADPATAGRWRRCRTSSPAARPPRRRCRPDLRTRHRGTRAPRCCPARCPRCAGRRSRGRPLVLALGVLLAVALIVGAWRLGSDSGDGQDPGASPSRTGDAPSSPSSSSSTPRRSPPTVWRTSWRTTSRP